MKMRNVYFVCLSLIFFSCEKKLERKAPPKLILQITIDQLRSDLPMTVYDRLPEGGFKYLYDNGVVYENAHHRHANTETVVGHATLATGADPSDHGMIANLWYDQEKKRTVYNVEDATYPLLGANAGIDKSTEIDPTQAAAGTDGRSPSSIVSTTFSDELFNNFNGKAKIFAVSVKDRGAITMAGHVGKAFWFSKSKGAFVTSSYYYDEYPEWVSEWNDRKAHLKHAGTSWELTHDISTYKNAALDSIGYKTNLPGYGVDFPHNYGDASNPYFTTFLTLSPVGDELTLDFSKALISIEEIGQDDITDYLSISFSSTDYVGHVFGPTSLEAEDNLLRLDRTLEDLFKTIDEQVGLENTLIVFSSDHGGPDAPDRLKNMGVDAGYFDVHSIDSAAINQSMAEKFNVTDKLVSGFFHPYVYFDRDIITNNGLDIDQVSRTYAELLQMQEGIAYAIPSIDLINSNVADTMIRSAVLRNYHPRRSGEIYVITKPHWFINEFEGLSVASTHGSPWEYDTHVPVIFAGHGIKPDKVFRNIETVDIAITLSSYLNINSPSGASGKPLIEILEE